MEDELEEHERRKMKKFKFRAEYKEETSSDGECMEADQAMIEREERRSAAIALRED